MAKVSQATSTLGHLQGEAVPGEPGIETKPSGCAAFFLLLFFCKGHLKTSSLEEGPRNVQVDNAELVSCSGQEASIKSPLISLLSFPFSF